MWDDSIAEGTRYAVILVKNEFTADNSNCMRVNYNVVDMRKLALWQLSGFSDMIRDWKHEIVWIHMN